MSQHAHAALLSASYAPPVMDRKALLWPGHLMTNQGGPILPAGTDFTVRWWMRLTAYANPPGHPGYTGSDSQQFLFQGGQFGVVFSPTYFAVQQLGIGNTFFLESPLPPGELRFVAFTYEAATQTARLYFGYAQTPPTLVATATGVQPHVEMGNMALGYLPSATASNNYYGLLADVGIAPFAQSLAELQATYRTPTSLLPNLADYALATDFSDVLPPAPGYAGFADLSGHGHTLTTLSGTYENDQVPSPVPYL